MPDFHCALLWLRSLEIITGHTPMVLMGELSQGLFEYYRSPYKA